MIFPSGPGAVGPETLTCWPIGTAREYPTSGSHGVPVAKFWRGILVLSGVRESESPLPRMLNLKEVWHRLATLEPGAGRPIYALQQHSGSRGTYPLDPAEPDQSRPKAADVDQGGEAEPRRLRERPHRHEHD